MMPLPIPLILSTNDGGAYWILGDRYVFKVRGADSGGRFMLLEATVFPGNGPPPHTHTREDETFYVLEGNVEVMVGGKMSIAGPGSTVYLPKGIVHTFKGVGDSPARMLVLAVPAGLDEFFQRIGRAVADAGETPPPITESDIAKVLEFAPEFGIQIAPPA